MKILHAVISCTVLTNSFIVFKLSEERKPVSEGSTGRSFGLVLLRKATIAVVGTLL